VEVHGQEEADKEFEHRKRNRLDGLNFAQFGRASSSKSKGTWCIMRGSED
jgi:hypothetical protein